MEDFLIGKALLVAMGIMIIIMVLMLVALPFLVKNEMDCAAYGYPTSYITSDGIMCGRIKNMSQEMIPLRDLRD